jgi:hypothetical protein
MITFYLTRIIPEKFANALFPPRRLLPPHPDPSPIRERGKSETYLIIGLR